MIKILSAHEVGPQDSLDPIPKLHVHLDIDGYEWHVGGLPVEWDRKQLLAFLGSQHNDMLRQAKAKQLEPSIEYPRVRSDLMDVVPRNIELEVDDIKARLQTIEAKVKPTQ